MLPLVLAAHLLTTPTATGPTARISLLPELHGMTLGADAAVAGPTAEAPAEADHRWVEPERLNLHLLEGGLSLGALLVTTSAAGFLVGLAAVSVFVAVLSGPGDTSGLVALALGSLVVAGVLALATPVVAALVSWGVARLAGDPGSFLTGLLGAGVGSAAGLVLLALTYGLLFATNPQSGSDAFSSALAVGAGVLALGCVSVGATLGVHWGRPRPRATVLPEPQPALPPSSLPPAPPPPAVGPPAPPPAARLLVPVLAVQFG